MKSLYININGEDIQSSENIIVVGTPDDAIADKFYYELGKEIVKCIDAPGIRGLAKHIVKSYKDKDEMSFGKITEQWLKVKDKLLGENPTGIETIELPLEYVKWLQNYGDANHTEIAKSLYTRNCLVKISLDKIYRNSVNIIINSIEPDKYGQFVVNDEVVTDDSAISIAIMKKLDGIAFKPYKKEDVCPKCGKTPCECVIGKSLFEQLFPLFGITLGETMKCDLNPQEQLKCHLLDGGLVYEPEEGITFGFNSYNENEVETFSYCQIEDSRAIPSSWKVLKIGWGYNKEKCLDILTGEGFNVLYDNDKNSQVHLCSPDKQFLFLLLFKESNALKTICVAVIVCPTCKKHRLNIINEQDCLGCGAHIKLNLYDEENKYDKIVHDIINDHPEWFVNESLDDSFYKGKTVNDVEEKRYDNWGNPISKYFVFYGFVIGFSKKDEIIEAKEERLYGFWGDTFDFYQLYTIFDEPEIPSFYRNLGVEWGKDLSEIRELFVKTGFKIEDESPYKLCFKSPYSTKYRAQLTIEIQSRSGNKLDGIVWQCFLNDWDLEDTCPICGTNDIEDNGSGYLQYTCNGCGHVWG